MSHTQLIMQFIEIGAAGAIACHPWIARGDKNNADQAAVNAIRTSLNKLNIDGRIAIGEGERDVAPMLYIGEKVGAGEGPAIDIALDPLEGTSLTAKGMANSMTAIAFGKRGAFLHAPDVYMEKIAIGPGYPADIIDLDVPPEEIIRRLAKAKDTKPANLTACVLERPRHGAIIAAIRKTGAAVRLITDNDIQAILHTLMPQISGIDLYIGTGGAPEGVLAATAIHCLGGQFQGRLVFRNAQEKSRAAKMGITDYARKYRCEHLASGDVVFLLTGVTDGDLLKGVRKIGQEYQTTSLVLESARRVQSTVITYWGKNDPGTNGGLVLPFSRRT